MVILCTLATVSIAPGLCVAAGPATADLSSAFSSQVRPLVQRYCIDCHSAKKHKGKVNLERFALVTDVAGDLETWHNVVEMLQDGKMPPDDADRQPTAREKDLLVQWATAFISGGIKARAGDPGRVVVRRLSNAEFDNTIRDLTGVDLHPTRQFPADGAAGEGFTNAGDALGMSPGLLQKYFNAAKDIAGHAVLLPDGFRFSASHTRRDWTDEAIASIRQAYQELSPAPATGNLEYASYLKATIVYRDRLLAHQITIEAAARQEKLNAKYLGILWRTLTDQKPSPPILDELRIRWSTAGVNDVPAIANEIHAWQEKLWTFGKVGSYMSLTWQEPAELKPATTQPFDARTIASGIDAFRECFPLKLHYDRIVPNDEIICLRLFFREDGYLSRLFLDNQQTGRLDRLWRELIFISQQPLVEQRNYPTFCGFVSQDSADALKNFKKKTEEGIRTRAEGFQKTLEESEPVQLQSLVDFASRAYRRPLAEKEKAELLHLYQTLRAQKLTHEEAFRLTLARVLVSPSFLYRTEHPAGGNEAQPVSNWELATRLSYFLWASTPDEQLRKSASDGALAADPAVLSAQTHRMLQSPDLRGLATEFATEWLHVRDIRDDHEKSEKLFPEFDDGLRSAMFEETVLFFEDLFQNDRPVLGIVNADYAFLNDRLAKLYGIPNVTGPEWRRVEGVNRFGRGGVLGMGSVLAKQSGAARTSPTLRGNWLVETLLGERIPNPPANVPKLPEDESADEQLTVRQMVEKHARTPECAVCHQRIDPFGMSLEKYDAIGRLRDHDIAGHPVDCLARLKDGTAIEGIDGLRKYVLDQRRDDFLRNFSRKLLGYALGRAVTLTDEPLIDEMLTQMKQHDYRVSAAVMAIVRSRQFRDHRAMEATKDE
jgi:hypothetical protein